MSRTKQDRDKSVSFILKYAYRECCSIVLGLIFLLGGSLSDLAVPIFIGRVIDYLPEEKFDEINELCLYMAIIICVSGICVGMRAAIFNILSERIARNLRRDFYESIMEKDVTFFDEIRTGDLGEFFAYHLTFLLTIGYLYCLIVSRLNSDI